MNETIVAIATPLGVGALAVLRLSGVGCGHVIAQCFTRSEALMATPRVATLGYVTDEDKNPLDEVLAIYFASPASFTGEDTIELTCHGGVYVTQALLSRLIDCGARAADPGEFTQRAFLNGKLDLTQAEGIMDIISAQSDLSLRAAQNQLQGAIKEVTHQLRNTLIEVIAHLEAYIDFPEEDVTPETHEVLQERLGEVKEKCKELLSSSYTGRLLREGARVVICGAPNAGKSSLLNHFLGYQRAIVSEIKGTTRDTIEEVMNIEGVPVRFIDTAGIRSTEEVLEQEGITRAYNEMKGADLVLEVIDGTLSPSKVSRPEISDNVRHIMVLNKEDRGIHRGWEGLGVRISCERSEGIKGLMVQISQTLLDGKELSGGALIAINARHQTCLRQLKKLVENAQNELRSGYETELISITLREALHAIGELTGKVDTEEILGHIFSQFCIGK